MTPLKVIDIKFNMWSIIYIVEPQGNVYENSLVVTADDIDKKDLVLKSNILKDNKVVFSPVNVTPAYYQKLLNKDSVYIDNEYQLNYIYQVGDICGYAK